jgi:hypothetical protein
LGYANRYIYLGGNTILHIFYSSKKLNIYDAGATAAAYGSVSAVTFVTAVSYLETHHLQIHGYMVATMALMESPAIIVGLLLISVFGKDLHQGIQKKRHLNTR